MTGRPRRRGSSRCATEAKNASRSAWRMVAWLIRTYVRIRSDGPQGGQRSQGTAASGGGRPSDLNARGRRPAHRWNLGRTEGYDLFPRFYDGIRGDRLEQARYLRSLFEQHHSSAKTVLELGCRTGSVLKQLHPRYEVTARISPRRCSNWPRRAGPGSRSRPPLCSTTAPGLAGGDRG